MSQNIPISSSIFDSNPDITQHEQPFWLPIGQFIMAFGSLEAKIDSAIDILLNPKESETDLVPSQIKNLTSRIMLTKALIERMTNDIKIRNHAKEVLLEIRRLNSYRNNLVHGSWGMFISHHDEASENYWTKVRFDGNDFKHKQFHVKLSDLQKNIGASKLSSSNLMNLVLEVARVHSKKHGFVPWFDKPFGQSTMEDQSLD